MLAIFHNSGYKVNTEFDGEVYNINIQFDEKRKIEYPLAPKLMLRSVMDTVKVSVKTKAFLLTMYFLGVIQFCLTKRRKLAALQLQVLYPGFKPA